MRFRGSGLIVLLMILTLNMAGWADTQMSETSRSTPELVEDGLDHLFQEANDSFLRHDLPIAAADIRKAAILLQAEADHAINETHKQTLLSSAQALDTLADAVQQGRTTDDADLKRAFARTHYVLARHFYQKSRASWLHKETADAGRALRSAADHVEYGLRWSATEIEDSTTTVLNDVRQLAGKLISGTGYFLDQFGQAYEALGKEIDKLGKKVTAAKS